MEDQHPSPEQLALLTAVTRKVARSRRLSPEDAEDFAQIVQVRVIERNYDIFHRFTGRSSLRTYLTVVVTRMLLDWLNATYGKWRPSAIALRLGGDAVKLERLIWRDGCTADEAIAIVAADPASLPLVELQALVVRLPRRLPRRRVPDVVLERQPIIDFEDPVEVADRRRALLAASAALRTALGTLSAEDRRLLGMRYQRRMPVQTIAKILSLEPKSLYRRFEQVLRQLRAALAAAGVTGSGLIDFTICAIPRGALPPVRRVSTRQS